MPDTAIIIRSKNEEKWIGECLKRIYRQTYKDFYVIVVDSGSTDQTIEIVKKYPVKLVQIPAEEFTYPHALNVGCMHADVQKYYVFLSAHSLPLSDTWLEDGLSNFTAETAGVYGPVYPLPDATMWEKIFFNKTLCKIGCFFVQRKTMKKSGMGVLGFTNAIIRKDLWKQHAIDEAFANGGEDQAWAEHWIGRGYVVVRDFRFGVYHSHGLGLRALVAQYKHWKSVAKPHRLEPRSYR